MPTIGVFREESKAQRRLMALRSIPILLLLLSILLIGKEIAAAIQVCATGIVGKWELC